MQKKPISINRQQQQQQKPDTRPLIMTFSDYSRSYTGLARQMDAIMEYFRREFRVMEVGIGANELNTIEERKNGNIVIPTQDMEGRSLEGHYYGQGVIDRVLGYQQQTKDMPLLCFVNHDIDGLLAIAPILQKYRIPIVYWCLFDNGYMWAYIENALSNFTDFIVYQTNFARNTVTERCPYLDVPVFYPSIKTDEFCQVKPNQVISDDQFFRKIEGKKIVLFIGKNQERKNIAVLLDAMKRIQDQGRNDIFCLIHAIATKEEFAGRDMNQMAMETTDIDTYARSIGLKHNNIAVSTDLLKIEILNVLYQVTAESGGVLAIPSCSEGLGMPFLESFQKSVPCISTNYSASSEILGDGRGYLIDPTIEIYKPNFKVKWAYINSFDLAQTIIKAVDSDNTVMIEKGKEWLKENNRVKTANKFIELFRDIISRRKTIKEKMPIRQIII